MFSLGIFFFHHESIVLNYSERRTLSDSNHSKITAIHHAKRCRIVFLDLYGKKNNFIHDSCLSYEFTTDVVKLIMFFFFLNFFNDTVFFSNYLH